jgi:hypothetical protein
MVFNRVYFGPESVSYPHFSLSALSMQANKLNIRQSVSAYIKVLQRDYVYVSQVQDDLVTSYSEANTQQKAAIEGIFANQFVQFGDVESATRAIGTIVTLLNKIDYENTQALHGIFLAVLALYDAYKETTLPTRALSIAGISDSSAAPLRKLSLLPSATAAAMNTLSPSNSMRQTRPLIPKYRSNPNDDIRSSQGESLDERALSVASTGSLLPDHELSVKMIPSVTGTINHKNTSNYKKNNNNNSNQQASANITILAPDNEDSINTEEAGYHIHNETNRTSSLARSHRSMRRMFGGAFSSSSNSNNLQDPSNALSPHTTVKDQVSSNVNLSHAFSSTNMTIHSISSNHRHGSLRHQTKHYIRSLYRKVQPTMSNGDSEDASVAKLRESLLDYATELLAAMKPIEKHIVAFPIMGMLRAFIKMADSSPRDAALMLRERYRVLERQHPKSMGLLVGVMAMKAWDASDKSEAWKPELSKGSLILSLAGIMPTGGDVLAKTSGSVQ